MNSARIEATDSPAQGTEFPAVVLLTELFPPFVGGSAVLFQETYSRLSDRQVIVLTDNERLSGRVPGTDTLEVVGGDLSSPNWGILKPSGLRQHLQVARQLRGVTRRQRSVVHCGRTLPEGLTAAFSQFLSGPSFYCWVHGEDLTMQLSTSREFRHLTRWVCRRSAGFFVNSFFTSGLLQDEGVAESKVHVIHPGVDPERFHPGVDGSRIRRRFAPNGEPLILSVGRLQRRKGFDLTISAVSKLRDELPDLRYVLVGEGEDRDYLRNLISQHGLSDRIFDVGRVADDELPEYYAACDIFVHPNRVEGVDVEGFGIVFLEAAASGRPSIGGRSGGVSEAVAEGESGILVSGTDGEELAAAIQSLVSSQEVARAMGTKGRQRVLEQFSWEQVAARLQSVMKEMGL